jgi:hypothetical protein
LFFFRSLLDVSTTTQVLSYNVTRY